MTSLATIFLCSIALVQLSTAAFNFVSIGDWGCMPMGGWHAQDEVIVARGFEQTATDVGARFVLNTGDNFYHCGVKDKNSNVWNTTFEDVFTAESTLVPWYSCLGNHDYGYPDSATIQMEYVSPKMNRWVLPDRYYYRRLEFPGEVNISLVVLDSSPCQAAYRSSNPDHWDPACATTDKKLCPGCTFHENVIAQSCSAQLTWLNQLLPTIPKDDWKIVMTHAPAYSLDVEDLLTPLQKHRFHLYLNGHIHLLEDYQMDGYGVYITTGAGCWVRVPGTNKTAQHPEAREKRKVPTAATGHKHTKVWEETIAGYTSHSFSADYQTLTTNFYNYEGHLLHSVDSHKGEHCCYYDSDTCKTGDNCCDMDGKIYKETTCDGAHGEKHHCAWKDSKCIVQ